MATLIRFLVCLVCVTGLAIVLPVCDMYIAKAARSGGDPILWLFAVLSAAAATVLFSIAVRSIAGRSGRRDEERKPS
jgi:hypothetical protein